MIDIGALIPTFPYLAFVFLGGKPGRFLNKRIFNKIRHVSLAEVRRL
jgi:hypothetical protein